MAKSKGAKKYILVTSTGPDKVGIVEEISEWIFQHGGNIEESRMSRLGNEFTTMILVSGPAELVQRLEETRESIQREHTLNVVIKAVQPFPPQPATPVLRYTLRATSLDHPGIVHQVTQVLRRRSINITSAATHTTPAPFSGTAVFHFQMEIEIPADVSVNTIRDELRALGEQEKIDFVLTPVTDD